MGDSVKLINAFREDLLRWNRQINLVSRQETEDRLKGLFNQCAGGVGSILNHLDFSVEEVPPRPQLFYFDLGSGGGLPGVVWHILFSDQFDEVKSWLVEPREKRAWFLKRLNRIPDMPPFGVLHGRWGDVCISDMEFTGSGAEIPVVVISLKALYLDDTEVLKGLFGAFSGFHGTFDVIIARYYPPEQIFDPELEKLLNIPQKGSQLEMGDSVCTSHGGGVVPLSDPGLGLASLVLSSYLVSPGD